MFECKFCLREMDRHYESKSHYGMCKSCYTRTMKYKRIKIRGGAVNHEEEAFIKAFEKQCHHNQLLGLYVPKMYKGTVVTKLDRCPYCGAEDVKVYPYAPNMCDDCGRVANTYRSTLSRLEGKIGWPKFNKDGSQAYAYDKALETIANIETKYEERYQRGYKVPGLYLERRKPR